MLFWEINIEKKKNEKIYITTLDHVSEDNFAFFNNNEFKKE